MTHLLFYVCSLPQLVFFPPLFSRLFLPLLDTDLPIPLSAITSHSLKLLHPRPHIPEYCTLSLLFHLASYYIYLCHTPNSPRSPLVLRITQCPLGHVLRAGGSHINGACWVFLSFSFMCQTIRLNYTLGGHKYCTQKALQTKRLN